MRKLKAQKTITARRLRAPDPIEQLERRVMLASAASAALVDPGLVALGQQYSSDIAAGRTFDARGNAMQVRDGSVHVEIRTLGNVKTLYTDLKKFRLHTAGQTGKTVYGWLPLDQVSNLDSVPGLEFARPILATLSTGSVTSQGDAAVRADIERSLYGYNGSGIKVGILSDSFDTGPGSYATDVSTGDLPAGVQVLEDYAGGTDEGRAMAQLVYDTAPGVSIAFATAFNGITDFANNIKALRDAGCKIIVDDVIYFEEPMFQDGEIAQAIDNVEASGVAYFSAAANQGRNAYDSAYRAGPTLAARSISNSTGPRFKGGVAFDFDPTAATDDMQQFTLAGGATMQLSVQWDQPYGSVPGSASCATEVDVYVLNSAGTSVVGGSTATNTGTGADPIEFVQFTNNGAGTGTYNLMIVKRSGTDPTEIKYVNFGNGTFTQFATNSGALFGHANAAGAAAVGAASWAFTPAYGVSPPVIESFSSAGTTNILFDPTGLRLSSPVVRDRPNFTAPDGGNTTFFYSDSSVDSDSLPNFFGTSAAAPVAGAVAAIMMSANSSLTPTQIYDVLQNTAQDMDDPSTAGFDTGWDSGTGFGLIRADAAVASILAPGTISGIAFRDYNADGNKDPNEPPLAGVTVFLDTNNNGLLDNGETSTTTLADGSYSFSVPVGSYYVRQQASPGSIATDGGPYSVTVTTGATVSGPSFGSFPTTFSGSSGADVYVVGLDPNNSSRVQISETLGASPAVLYSIAQSRVPALSFNTGAGDDVMTINGPLTTAINFALGTGNDTANLNGGNYTFASDLSLSTADLLLNVNAGTATFGATQHLRGLNIASDAAAVMSADGNRYLQTSALSLAGTAKLDLNDNDLVVEYSGASPFTQIQQWVFQGYSQSPDPSASGIISTTGQNSTGSPILALFDNANAGVTEWPAGSGNSVPSKSILGKYTYEGDTNLDGKVTADDYGALDANFGQAVPAGQGWLFGDTNLDGVVTADDYGALDANFGLGQITPL